ncbi:MAG: hypothetical protein ABIK83_10300 [Candidatus Zixiibacteriota bacterium]
MQSKQDIPVELDEVSAEIASILARGFMCRRKGARFGSYAGSDQTNAADIEESETIAEKPLDCSRRL